MLQPHQKANFHTLERAFANGDVCLLECTDAKTGGQVATICAVQRHPDKSATTIPIATLIVGNPYEQLVPPTVEN
jgi:Family of unknown function (DUF6117)